MNLIDYIISNKLKEVVVKEPKEPTYGRYYEQIASGTSILFDNPENETIKLLSIYMQAGTSAAYTPYFELRDSLSNVLNRGSFLLTKYTSTTYLGTLFLTTPLFVKEDDSILFGFPVSAGVKIGMINYQY